MRSFSHFGFVPLNNFSMIAFSNALEVLRMANYLERKELYRWSVLGVQAGAVMASNGLSLPVTAADPDDVPDIVFVCGGVEVEQATDAATLALLRDCAAAGSALGGLCTGSYALAVAGLLDGYRCASHWEQQAALTARFPALTVSPELFVIDRDRYTCSGGVAPLDMMLNIISARVGSATIARIAGQFIHEHVRDQSDRQSVPLAVRMACARPAMLEVVQLMEANLEEPLSLDELVRLTRASPRQMQRMFKQELDTSPTKYYQTLRLQKARELLRQTDMSLDDIMVACGFQSACHFRKVYRELFKVAPSTERRHGAAWMGGA